MLAEWGGLYNPANPTGQADFFQSVTTQVASFPALKALVYFDIDTQVPHHQRHGHHPQLRRHLPRRLENHGHLTAIRHPHFTYTNGTITPTT